MKTIRGYRTAFVLVLGLMLSACNQGGNDNSSSNVSNSADVTPPAVPSELALTYRPAKIFRFDWTDVGDATYYQLFEDPDSNSGFTQVGSNFAPGVQTYDHVVPLYARANARYFLRSCNPAGCKDSDIVHVAGNLASSVGYFKASNTGVADLFGYSVSLSSDGGTLAVGAIGEASSATGVGGGQTDNSALSAGAVYVFVRSGSSWVQQAYIKASNTDDHDYFGQSVSLGGDGDTLAVGAGREASSATGVNGNQADNSASAAGAVYVFSRTGGTWSQQAYIKASNTDASDAFGQVVSLSSEGNVLAVGANGESSNATGINGNQADNSASRAGAVYVFSRSGSIWSQQAYVKASNTEGADQFGSSLSLSGDGSTLAVGASGESSSATGIGGDQTDNSASISGAVYVFSRSGNAWTQQAYVKASNASAGDVFSSWSGSVSLSSDGNTLAVGAVGEDSSAVGIDGDQADNSAAGAGAVYVFVRSGGTWSQQAYVKASNAEGGDGFGKAVSLSGDGNTMAIGAYVEDSSAKAIDGNQADNLALRAGAVYVFNRSGSVWSQQAYVKASNTEADDRLGFSVGLSEDGASLAAAANAEASSATGVDGNQADNLAKNSGAVYLY